MCYQLMAKACHLSWIDLEGHCISRVNVLLGLHEMFLQLLDIVDQAEWARGPRQVGDKNKSSCSFAKHLIQQSSFAGLTPQSLLVKTSGLVEVQQLQNQNFVSLLS